jgi:toxin ParE1/3/4
LGYRLSLSAEDELAVIRAKGIREWGRIVADRYDLLLDTVIAEIVENPFLPGSAVVPKTAGAFTYAIKLSKTHVPARDRIKTPRHVVVYRVAKDGVVEILGFVHDRMLLAPAVRHAVRNAAFREPPTEP